MAADELSAPLRPRRNTGEPAPKAPRAKRMIAWSGGVLAVAIAALAGWVILRHDPFGGEPVVVLDMNAPPPAAQGGDGSTQGNLSFRSTIEDGQGQDNNADGGVAIITRLDSGNVDLSTPGSGSTGGAKIINITGGGTTGSDTAAAGAIGSADSRVVEQANIGLLPRVGQNGEKASEVYAKPAHLAAAIGSEDPARIAIMIGGLGISASITDEAIARLPEAVTLAFAPYGRDLQVRVDQARRAGHEVMLQLPMEPFDYPDNDPGPHTLLAGAANSDNLERLYWLMARFTGYFGVTNYMGAKFTSDGEAIRPIQKELARRGLVLLDDGSSQRSQLATTASAQGLTASRADVVIDLAQSRSEIASALAHLEAIARERGYAIGTGAALPATLDAVAAWAEELASRGIILVPVSAALKSGRQS